MYRKQIRRRRAVLALLVISSFVLLTATYGQGSGSFQEGVATIFSPLQKGADRALKPARDLVNWFDETFDARGENDRLHEEVARFRKQAAAGKVALQQNNELRAMLDLNRSVVPSGYEEVAASVIVKSPTAWYARITIDRGTGSGVEVNDPVVTGDGVVGRVAATTSGSAQVILITDPDSRVAGKVADSGAQGVVTPVVGDPSDLTLDFLDSSKELRRGQLVVTAGFRGGSIASHFPPNLPIGLITEAPVSVQEAAQKVHLTPVTDLANLDVVEVLTGGDR